MYKYFKGNNINTLQVFYYAIKGVITKEKEINAKKLILKPIYGTEGSNIVVSTYEKFIEYSKSKLYNGNLILQEHIKDCTTNLARHFRVTTHIDSNNKINVFFIDERKQTKGRARVPTHYSDLFW